MTDLLYPPIYPAEILMGDFLEGFGITQHRLAVDILVPPRHINEIVHGQRAITADTALRLAKYFGTTAEFWMNLQNRYDLACAAETVSDENQGDRASAGRVSWSRGTIAGECLINQRKIP